MIKQIGTLLAAMLLSQAVSANHHEESETTAAAEAAPMAGNTIVDVAVGAGSFTTLVAALKAASLVETLSGRGPFTVLAPTDEAFAALPPGALDNLLANPDQLAEVLKLHVVAGEAKAADVVALDSVTTLQGPSLPVDTADGVSVGGAAVIQADVAASNGVIHVIDRVILPTAE